MERKKAITLWRQFRRPFHLNYFSGPFLCSNARIIVIKLPNYVHGEQCFHHARTKAALLVSAWTCLHSYFVLVFLTSLCQLGESTKEQRTRACLCMDTAGARHFCGGHEYMYVSFSWKKKKATSFVVLWKDSSWRTRGGAGWKQAPFVYIE